MMLKQVAWIAAAVWVSGCSWHLNRGGMVDGAPGVREPTERASAERSERPASARPERSTQVDSSAKTGGGGGCH
jgi:hypothetical protein